MTPRTSHLASIGILLALGCGLLKAQAGAEGREAKAATVQGEGAAPVRIKALPLEGLNLDFSRETGLHEICLQLGRKAGVSILYHASAKDVPVVADLRGLSFQAALDTLMLQNDLFYRVLTPTSVMVFKRTPQNLAEFENKSVRTFCLAHAEVDTIRMSINALFPQIRVTPDKALNAITVMAKASDLRAVQQLIHRLDKAKGEVVVYLDLLEVSRKAAEGAGILPGGKGKGAISSAAMARLQADPETRVLASPSLRVTSGATGEFNVERKAGSPTVDLGEEGGEGLWAKVKPRVHAVNDLTVELEFKVSEPGATQRALRTTTRLKDGETAVFGGFRETKGTQGGADRKKERILAVRAVVVRAPEAQEDGKAFDPEQGEDGTNN